MNPWAKKSYSKFKNKKVYDADGNKVADSGLEGRHRLRLIELGYISSEYANKARVELVPPQRQGKKYIVGVNYIPDFIIAKNGHTYYLDSKGVRTPEFKIKAKLMQHRGTPVLIMKNNKHLVIVTEGIAAGKSPLEIFASLA